MESLFLTAVVALLINVVAEITKRWKVPAEWVLLSMAILAGGAYQAFVIYLPVESQQNVLLFATQTVGTAVLVYEFLIKRLKKSL